MKFDQHTGSPVLQERPKLRSVISEFVHDSTVSKRDHIMQALGPIKSELESKIRAAKEMTKQKKQARIESRRRAEAAVRAVKQNDEARREQRERIIVERKRQEAEESLHVYSNTASDDDSEPPKIVPSVRHKRPHNTQSSKARQGAEFFFPQSQDSLSDEETPTEPKSLLHSFSTVRSASQKTSIELDLSADKRVHWKDGGSDASDGMAIEERKEGKLEKNVKQSGTSSCVSITVGNELPREEEEKSKEHSPVVKNAPTLQQSGASSFGPVVLTKDDTAEDFVEEKRINDSEKGKPARKARQYGKSKRGLEAISRSRQCQKRSSGDTEAKPSLHQSFDKRSEPFIVVDLGGNNSLRRKEKNERNISILSEGKANHSSASKKIQKGESLDTKKPKVVEVLRARVDIEASKQRNRGGLLLQSAASTAKSSYSKDPDHKKADCIFLDSGKSQEDSHEQIRCKKRDEGFSSVDGKNPNKSEQQKNVLSRQRSQSLTCRTHGPPNISNEVACTKARSRTVASVSPRELSHSKSEGGSRVETSRKSTSKSVASGSSRISSPKKTDATTKKRKMQEQSLLPTQPSGLSSAEGAPKSRRRKKSSSSHRSSIGMADDAYSFAF